MNKQSKAEFYLFLTTFIYGSTFVIFKFILNYISPVFFISLRYGIAAIIFYLIYKNQLVNISKSTFRKGIILGLLLGVGIIIQTVGVAFTTASKSAFITGMMVVFTPIAQIFVIKKSPTISNFLGIITVILGFYFLTYPIEKNINFGDILVLIASFLFGVYIVYLDIFSRDENSFQITFLQFVATAIISIIFLPFEKIKFILTFDLIWMLTFMIVLATLVSVYIQTHYQKDTTPTKAVIIFSIEPVIASILAYFFLSENIGLTGVIGGSLILIGIFISEFSEPILKKFLFKNAKN